ncbi:MAG: polysaccharide biosynthesis C-terminal domain-containing protein [Candidatus Eisenbacteria bacterium]|nr:polysaccharide biosynthesis C-terminal domain-containing protein [Candidatus Eisenbacteria bacterium]
MQESLEDGVVERAGRSVLRHSIMTFGTRVAIVLVNVPTSILIARLLGVQGQGAYSSSVILPTLFAFAGLLGVDSAHTFLLSRREFSRAQVNGQSLLLAGVLAAVITPLYLVFLRFYNAAADPGLRSVLTVGATLIPVLLAKYLAVAFLLGLEDIRRFNLANLLQAAALLALMAANLLVFRGGVRGAIVAYATSELAATGVGVAVACRAAHGGRLVERPPRVLLRRSLVYGLQGHLGNILVLFTYRFDTFLVLSMAGLPAQGLYSIAVVLAEKLSHIPESIQVVLFPRLAALDAKEANRLTPRAVRSSLLATTVAAVALWLLSRPLLLLFFGEEFLGSLGALRVLLPGVVMLSVGKILSTDFSGRDRRVYYTVGTAIAFAINVVLGVLWIPRWGIVGAAWASTVAYTVQAAVMLAFFRRLSGKGALETVVPGREEAAVFLGLLRKALGRR